ncbi:MAG: isoprenylcysteine carboxylmethyltransferase family protein [Planctomycetes bacterium]|nr:isoprenylcysteine carboxylmethyltransferase family protein [Planctomycetota bacterium]
MRAYGVGPWFALGAAACIGAAGGLEVLAPQRGAMSFLPRWASLATGGALIATGLVVWIWSLALVLPAFGAGRLVTHGPYHLCRNPAYASWLLLLLPGYAFLRDSWVKLLLLLPLYFVTLLLVKKEERFLEAKFGSAWREYRARVRALLPLPQAAPPQGRADS